MAAAFYPSPNRDNGYDVSDYYGVDPRHGTLGDSSRSCTRRSSAGIRVIVDLVVNHTSDRHPWFQQARGRPESSLPRLVRLVEDAAEGLREGMVFPGVQKTTWTWDERPRRYYFHRFYDFQPDLNTANPGVREEIQRIMGFWLQLGVSGFRMDAVPFLIERKGADVQEPPRTTSCCTRCVTSCRGAAATRSCSPRPTSRRSENLQYFGERGDRCR